MSHDYVFIAELESQIALSRLYAARSFRLYGNGKGQQDQRAYYRQARRHMRRARATHERLLAYKRGVLYPCTGFEV